MEEVKLEDIKSLLDKIFIFDDKYKDDILSKAAKIKTAERQNIYDLLLKVEVWQRNIYEQKLKTDPALLQKLSGLIHDKKRILNELKADMLASKDREKISKVLSFIDKL